MGSTLKTWWGQLLVVVLSIAGLEAVLKLHPSLSDGAIVPLLSREFMLIGGSLVLIICLVRNGPISAASMGWKRPTWGTLGFGLLCLVASVIVSAAVMFAMRKLGLEQNATVLATLGAKPVWALLLIALTAGISEEILFRGVILNYLAGASGKVWIGALGSLAIFALLHAGTWGWSQVLFAAIPGAVLTGFFLWKRDLGVCIVSHVLVDTMGLLAAYAQVHSA